MMPSQKTPAESSNARSFARKFGIMLLCALLAVGTALPSFSAAVQSAEAADNTLVIAIDPGHGGKDPGATGNGLNEKDANWRIAMACVNELNTYSSVKVVVTRGQNEYVSSLAERVQRGVSQGADVVISFHCNAAENASAHGAEVWVPNTTNYHYNETRVAGYDLGSLILQKIVALGFEKRGVYTRNSESGTMYKDAGGNELGIADYYGIIYNSRLNGIPGIIIEHGFVSNAGDASKLKDSTWCTKLGVADATAIAEYYGLSKIPQNGSSVPDGDVTKEGAAIATEQVYETDSPIMGTTEFGSTRDAAISRMAAWYTVKTGSSVLPTYSETKNGNNSYANYGARDLSTFCGIIYDEALAEGVRPEVVFAQMMLETGWLKFEGDVNWWQCNFCGLGATGNGVTGEDFSSHEENAVRTGVRAQVQHLKAYASTEDLNQACVDNRFTYVTRGVATTVQGLSGTWAADTSYGDNLVVLVNDLLGVKNTATTQVEINTENTNLEKDTQTTAYVNGEEVTLTVDSNGKATLPISGSEPQSIVLYEYKTTDNVHTSYPTGMSTWLVNVDKNGNYVTTRYYGLEDLLIYSGCSIRTTGNKGIRMVTGISSNVKNALTGTSIDGYTLVKTGTLITWASNVQGADLTLDTPSAVAGVAYDRGKANPVYAKQAGIEYYTNVLVGFSERSHYVNDLAMRPYATLQDANGNQFTIYGGTIYRSIEYIANQYAGLYAEGTSAHSFVQGIIDACK